MEATEQQQSKPGKRAFQFSLRSLLIAVTVISILYGCVITFWKPVGVYLMRTATARSFPDNYDNSDRRKYREVIAVGDWAWHFGGSSGLATLDELASDQDLATGGREEAARIRKWIYEGKHVPDLRAMVEGELAAPVWPFSSLIGYIYLQDSKIESSNSSQSQAESPQ